MNKATYIGVDVGTSGVRAIAINSAGCIQAEAHTILPEPQTMGAAIEQQPDIWWQAVQSVLQNLITELDADSVKAICVDATSGTVLLADDDNHPQSSGLMYNDNRAIVEARHIDDIAPTDSAAHGTGSGLAKILWLLRQNTHPKLHACTQSDWITTQLSGIRGICDANNALKLGYDPVIHRWPAWIEHLNLRDKLLPSVRPAGHSIGPIRPELANAFGVNEKTLIISGTTDSTAAFIASGASHPGEAVTALGSTLVLKVVSDKPVFAPEFGVYSHPMGDRWLVGGASNSGGAVLRQFFTEQQMTRLTKQLQPEQPTGLDYYPLPAPGERFPVNDAQRQPRLSPRPESDWQFFQALLEGIADIEKAGYDKLAELGAPYPVSVRSNGGGASNRPWSILRSHKLGVPMLDADHTEAAYGSALLARQGSSAV